MYNYQTTIRFHDADAAGVLFFANQFKLVHDAYEALMESKGFRLTEILAQREYILPIVYAASDLKAPLRAGDRIEIALTVKRLGDTSVTLSHRIHDRDKRLVGEGETVHVCVDAQSGQKRELPLSLRQALESI